MIKIFASFVVLWSVLILGIVVWQSCNPASRTHIVKTVGIAGGTALLTVGLLTIFVALF